MEESPGYRRNLARAFVRLYRPLTCGRRRRSRLDQLMARWWTRLDVVAYRHLGVSLGVKALGVDDVLLLRTRGRRSGQVREVLVAYVELGGVPGLPPLPVLPHAHRQALPPRAPRIARRSGCGASGGRAAC